MNLTQEKETKNKEEGVKMNGFLQVVDLLRTADLEFRNSLLRRIKARNPELANQLTKELKKLNL